MQILNIHIYNSEQTLCKVKSIQVMKIGTSFVISPAFSAAELQADRRDANVTESVSLRSAANTPVVTGTFVLLALALHRIFWCGLKHITIAISCILYVRVYKCWKGPHDDSRCPYAVIINSIWASTDQIGRVGWQLSIRDVTS